MVKLVGVVSEEREGQCEGGSQCSSPVSSDHGSMRQCLARRQFPLVIEPGLTMMMALDDSCVACGHGSTHGSPRSHGDNGGLRSQQGANTRSSRSKDPAWEVFLRNYRR